MTSLDKITPAEQQEVEEFKQYMTYRFRKLCNSLDMIDISMLDKNLSEAERGIKDKKIKAPMRHAVSDYQKLIREITEGRLIISKGVIKIFKEVSYDGKNTGSKKST